MLDVYVPDCEEFCVFVYFHGGGLKAGNKEQEFVEDLVKKGVAVVCANYRLYPSAVYPEFVRDAAAAVAWTYKHINEYGKCNKYFVGGSSAGGYLSMMLCFDKTYLAPYGINPAMLNGFIHDAGQPTTHFSILRERGIDIRRVVIDEAAPLFHIGKDLEYAPMLFIVSDNDMKNRYEQTMLVLSTLKHFKYDQSKIALKVMNGTHTHYVNKQDENGNFVFADMINNYIASRP